MFLNKKSLKLTKKILFAACLIFVVNMIFPNYVIAAENIDSKYGQGPINLTIVNHSDNQILVKIENPKKITSSLPKNESLPYYTMYTTATAYSSTVDQCDGDPFTAAWGNHVYFGMLASNYFPRGTKIQIPEYFGNKMFSVEDTMNQRYYNRIDIWMQDRQQAKEWVSKCLDIRVFR